MSSEYNILSKVHIKRAAVRRQGTIVDNYKTMVYTIVIYDLF